MRKFLKPKDILLLGLANLLDATEEFRDPFHLISSSYKSMYGWVPEQYRKHNFYQLLSRSYKANFIEKIEKGGKIYIRITSEGKKTIQRDFPMLSLQKRKWDGRWRIIMFDVEEVNKKVRNRLRRKLRELGFGMLQKSVFISPHDLLKDFGEFAQASGIKDYLYLLETHKLIVGNVGEFANRIWKLDDLNEKYKNIVDSHLSTIDDRITQSDSHRRKDEYSINSMKSVNNINSIKTKVEIEAKAEFKDKNNIKTEWLRIVINDPFLPKEFLPKPWYGHEAEKFVGGLNF